PAVAEHGDVLATINVVVEGLDGFPNGHVEQDPFVVEGANASGIAVIRLQPPDESAAPVRQRIDAVQLCHETGHDRVLERCAHAGDVGLSEVIMGARAHSSLLAMSDQMITSIRMKENHGETRRVNPECAAA